MTEWRDHLTKLYDILGETTIQLRKGDVLEGTPALVDAIKAGGDPDRELPGGVVEAYFMPPISDARPGLDQTDMEFLVIGVDRALAEKHRAEVIDILNAYPQPDRLAGGPSYIEVGGELGDQGAAFQLFALGKTLGLWTVITPASFGMTGAEAHRAAGNGFIMISGYRPALSRAEQVAGESSRDTPKSSPQNKAVGGGT